MELANGITQDDLKLFLQEADEQLQLLDEDIVRLEKESGSPDLMQEIFRAAHTLKGSSAMVGHQRLSELAHAMENVLDNVRKSLLAVSPPVVDALLHGLDLMRLLRQEMVIPDAKPNDISAAVAELNAAMKGESTLAAQTNAPVPALALDEESKTKLTQLCTEGQQGFRVKMVFDKNSAWAAVRCFQTIQSLTPLAQIILSRPTSQEIDEGKADASFEAVIATSETQEKIKQVLTAVQEVVSIEVSAYKEEVPAPPPKSKVVETAAVTTTVKDDGKLAQTVRVDVDRLDTLMEQVGELVINRNQIGQIGKVLAEKYHDDETVATLANTVTQIAKIVSTLQQDVMSIRMLPIEIVFNTLPRLVRDLARKENKKVDFIIEGQETEVDRSVIEHLKDPLIHLLRNSVDHGIESPQDRIAAGKPETGTIRLTAYHEQDNIMITLEDDGKGIDPNALRQTAVNKKTASAEAIAKMTDAEVINLIFASGFSTAKKITEVSGRGVGLDVVKTNVEVLNGSVNVDSVPGKGTTFTLTLPLTLAIIPALLVKTADTICAVPLSSIVETSKLEVKDIQTIRGREVTMFRNSVLPLLRLDEVFGWNRDEKRTGDSTHVVIVKFSGSRVGLTVDALLEQQELVVKSLDQYVGGSNGITGASILGDGTVVLILDVASLIRGAITERQSGFNKNMVTAQILKTR